MKWEQPNLSESEQWNNGLCKCGVQLTLVEKEIEKYSSCEKRYNTVHLNYS